jgi:GGDEF domain-containing protein/PAS domain-containing protein
MNETELTLKEQLKEWEKFLDAFGSLLPGGVGVYECSDMIRPIYLSRGVRQLCTGFDESFYREAENNALCILSESEIEKLKEAMRYVMEKGKMLDCTLRYRKTPKKDGWVWVRGRLADEMRHGKVLFAVLLDVTRQKELESELSIQNERYRILEQTSNEMLFDLRLDEDELTYSYKEINGELIRKRIPHYSKELDNDPLVHPDNIELFRKHLQIAMSRKIDGQLEYLSRISGHGHEWHRMYYSSLTDESGHVNRIIGRIRNVHDEVLERQQKKEEIEFGQTQVSGIRHRIWQKLENAEFDDKHLMAIVSINHYKRIIEQNGVAWGDAAVKGVAEILKTIIGERAIMGRTSDGEVLLYFQNLSDEEMDALMEKIVCQVQLPENQVAGITVSCTIGAAVMYGIVDYTSFYQETEEALHIAKITKGEHYIRV